MKLYNKDIAIMLSGAQVTDLLNCINKIMPLVNEEDKAVQAMLHLLAKKLMFKIMQKAFEPRPQKVKMLTEHAAVLHYIHCNYMLSNHLSASEANTMQICVNVIDQKLA